MANRKLEKAKEMINKRVVIGITYLDQAGEAIGSDQLHGKIISVNLDSVKVELEGLHEGEKCSLPRDLRAFHKAEPGTYTLNCSGEEVQNPDYTTVWNITRPPEGRG